MDTKKIILTNNWKFHYGECEDAWYKGYNDSSWEEVTIPHDFSVTEPFSQEYSSGTGYVRGGIAWYRLLVRIPEEYRGKKISVVFDGIYKNSMVWVNSYYMGKRPNGYSEICYDITDQASFGDDLTQISVKVIHTDLADSRWFTGSGITRKATLIVSEPITPVLHGITFNTISVTRDGKKTSARISVKHDIFCGIPGTGKKKKTKVISQSTLIDAKGKSLLVMQGELNISENGTESIITTGELKSPKLWSPDSPYLYTLETRLSVDGASYLVDSQRVGIRTFSFDPNKGFTLNDKSMKFKGVCVHHDGGCLGAAMKKEVWRRRLELLKKSGCNAIRCSHNPHMPELYDLCDEMGFMMMDEAFDEWENPKNKWSTGHNVYPPKHQGYYEDFPMWHEIDLRTMVRRDRNHPSVIMYSIGNEIDYPNDPYCHPLFSEMTGNNDKNKPAKERQFDINKPNMERLAVIAKELAAIVRDEDPTRPVTVAAAFPELSTKIGFIDEFDVVGYNYKEHLYEQDHKRFPKKTFLGSENGHSVEAWNAVKDNDYICGQFLWTGIDYLGEAHGWPIHGSGAGFITTAGFPKEEFAQRSKLWGGRGCKKENPQEVEVTVWTPEEVYLQDLAAVEDVCLPYIEDDKKVGYLYQIIVRIPRNEAEKLSWNGQYPEGVIEQPDLEKEILAQVTGAGELAGIDNGDLSDLTPFNSSSRKTFNGNLVIYVRRLAPGKINLVLSEVVGEKIKNIVKKSI